MSIGRRHDPEIMVHSLRLTSCTIDALPASARLMSACRARGRSGATRLNCRLPMSIMSTADLRQTRGWPLFVKDVAWVMVH